MWNHGSTNGFRSVIERFPDERLTVVILANRDDLDVRALAEDLAASRLDRRPSPWPLTAGSAEGSWLIRRSSKCP
jgi:hypothetical protein